MKTSYKVHVIFRQPQEWGEASSHMDGGRNIYTQMWRCGRQSVPDRRKGMGDA